MTTLQNRKYLILILTLAGDLIVESFDRPVAFGSIVSDMLIALVLLAVFLVVFTGWRQRTVAFTAAAAATAVDLSRYLIPDPYRVLQAVALHSLLLLFLGFAVVVILSNIFAETAITVDKVLGAVCGYLLAAGMWANAYALTVLFVPGSFRMSPELAHEVSSWYGRVSLFNYFSVVTLTTMGYGDVTPVRPPATSLAMLEAVFGQFYIAVVVAQLVGLRLAQAFEPKNRQG